MRTIHLLVLAFAGACLSVGNADARNLRDFQQDCERKSQSFRLMVDCTERKTKSTLRYKIGGSGAGADYYFSVGYFLADEIEAGRISESEAKLKLAAVYLQLQSEERMRGAQSSQLMMNFLNTYNQQFQTAPQATKTYVINGKMITCTTTGTITNCF